MTSLSEVHLQGARQAILEDLAIAPGGAAEPPGRGAGGPVEGALEVREVGEADVERDVGHRALRFGQQSGGTGGVVKVARHFAVVEGVWVCGWSYATALGAAGSALVRTVKVVNHGLVPVTYDITHVPALATGPFTFVQAPGLAYFNAPAGVTLSRTSVTVAGKDRRGHGPRRAGSWVRRWALRSH